MNTQEIIDRLTTAAGMLKHGFPVPPAVLTEAADLLRAQAEHIAQLEGRSTPAPSLAGCRLHMQASGAAAVPRTCPRCRLGPCQNGGAT